MSPVYWTTFVKQLFGRWIFSVSRLKYLTDRTDYLAAAVLLGIKQLVYSVKNTTIIYDIDILLWQKKYITWTSRQSKEKRSYKHMSRNEGFFSLNERLHSMINTLTMSYFTYGRHNTFKTHVSKLKTVQLWLFIKSKFVTNAENVPHLNQWTHGYTWLWTDAPFQRSRGDCG